MQDNNEFSMLSVVELNNVLNSLKKERNPILSQEPYSQVDIVFVAGLFLWYMHHKDIWKKISLFFNITENENAWNHSHYFQQIYELYNVKFSDIFLSFPNAINSNANSFSRYAVPPIYITNRSIDYFFGCNSHPNYDHLKEKYKNNFSILDFVDIRYKSFSTNEQLFKDFAIDIQQRLNASSPIFVYIFVVACKRLSLKSNRTFENTKDYVEKIWLFTQSYINGLYELALNIVEHSGKGDNNGQGIITIRAYKGSNYNINKIKVLETHVFDYGEEGIYKTLIDKTKKNILLTNDDIYAQDLEILTDTENIFTISDFIEPIDNKKLLLQQFHRELAHYGLMNFKNLIEKHEGMIIASSIRKDDDTDNVNINKREQYIFSKNNINDEQILNNDITQGTSYYFEMPFIPSLFEEKIKNEYDSITQHTISSLENFQNVKLLNYSDIDNYQFHEENKYLINFKLSEFKKEIINRVSENEVCDIIINFSKLNNFSKLKNNYYVFDFDGVKINKSNLLRILAKLSRASLSDFIVYNIDNNIFIKLIEDNEQWYKKTEKKSGYFEQNEIDTSYWYKDKSILFYTRHEKIEEIEGVQQKKYFYFADFLFGENSNMFKSINMIVSNTFPNTICVIKNEEEFKLNNNFIIPHKLQNIYFYKNSTYLLPFDILLKSTDRDTNIEKELFLFNIKTILQNKLFGRGTYYKISDYVDNFDGYHIPDTHFKIGNKVHSSDFYYAKRLFQNSFYTTRLAINLAKKINEKLFVRSKKITLVGYEIYSELILSLIEKFLKDIYKFENVSHFVAQCDGDKWFFLSMDTFNNYINEYEERETIIIVPIAATGSTSRKIENEIRNSIYKKEKDGKIENEKIAASKKNEYCFFSPVYNIILAQDQRKDLFKQEINECEIENKNYEAIINLSPKWYKIKDCELCFNRKKSLPLFDTDNSSLTPSLIFGNPEGIKKSSHGDEIENTIVEFDDLNFDNTLGYQNVSRNDNYRIYDIDSDRFINSNYKNIIKWLKYIKFFLEKRNDALKLTDNVVIVSPCHESNSTFLNLINEYVFYSAATIIHHQKGVDFVENFSLLNKNYLKGKNTKIIYVDDSLITGSHFFELFDLIRKVTENDSPLTASIFINDQASPFIHNLVVERSILFFVFSIFNLPPTLNMRLKKPLEHERLRYESLKESTLHDTLREHFYEKSIKLCPEKRNTQNKESIEKQIRRLKMFEATHKIYHYFTKNDIVPDLTNEKERNEFVEFNLKQKMKEISKEEEYDTNSKALLKVLSQYPFILYKDLRTATFKWHKLLIQNIITSFENDPVFNMDKDYHFGFSTFKFLLRRAAFIGNYQILEKDFLNILLNWFIKIDNYIEKNSDKFNNQKLTSEQKNLRDFPIFVLGNYIEMIQKNGWVVFHILNEIENMDFSKSKNQGRQFLSMLKIESATIIDEFMEMINKDYRITWRELYKSDDPNNNSIIDTKTEKIKDFFKQRSELLNITNKYSVVKDTLLNNTDFWEKEEFINFLWIKQLLYVDSIDEKKNLPQEGMDYQGKIDFIIAKMKGFFSDKNIQAFFIVTDGQEIPYVQYQENDILRDFKNNYVRHKEEVEKIKLDIRNFKRNNEDFKEKEKEIELKQLQENPNKEIFKYPEFIKFLNGTHDTQYIAYETTAEYQYEDGLWKNIYNNEFVDLELLPETRWLFLIRISELQLNKEGRKEKFLTQGLLGFYSDYSILSEEILGCDIYMMLFQK